MQQGTICLWRLAAYVMTLATTESVQRRFYRFFQYVRLDGALMAPIVIDLLGLRGKPWVLAINRTNWDFGKTTINILMIAVVWNGMGIPLIWMLLPSAGNSNTATRVDLLDRLHALFPDLTIACLMGDREFIGDDWMAKLKSRADKQSTLALLCSATICAVLGLHTTAARISGNLFAVMAMPMPVPQINMPRSALWQPTNSATLAAKSG